MKAGPIDLFAFELLRDNIWTDGFSQLFCKYDFIPPYIEIGIEVQETSLLAVIIWNILAAT